MREGAARERDLFEAALATPAGERVEFLERACDGDARLRGRVERLLSAYGGAGSFLEAPIAPAPEPEGDRPAVERIGRYRLVRRLGEGGMGVVFEAEQDQPRRTVALKLMRPGLAARGAVKRFRLEGELLGRLEHPLIARIYDAGSHVDPVTGLEAPYFVMEFVDGRPITDFVTGEGLATRERLALFASVCDGVQHAHQRGVIHRDLKPGNILIDRGGRPKILDFGVARATESDLRVTTIETAAGQIVGTLPYMSPEQAGGDAGAVDTRSDVYSLGVVLYELLTGRLPYEVERKAMSEVVRIIRDEDPARLSSVDRVFRGDVETIVSKAIEKERERRYASAAELGADIRRFLDDEPIVARPPTAMYQFRKFARRNRATVVAAGAIAGTLAVASGASLVMAAVAVRQRDTAVAARTEAQTATRQMDHAVRMLQGMLAPIGGSDVVPMHEVVQEARAVLDSGDVHEPLVEAVLRELIGRALFRKGRFAESLVEVRRAADLRLAEGESHAPELWSALLRVAYAHSALGDIDGTTAVLRELLERRRAALGPDHMQTAELELALMALMYLPETPEADWGRERPPGDPRSSDRPVGPGAEYRGPVVFEHDFGSGAGEGWERRVERVRSSSERVEDGRLVIDDIEPEPGTDDWASVALARRLQVPLGDFHAEISFEWESEDGASAVAGRALQFLRLELNGRERPRIAWAGYRDVTIDWLGERLVLFEERYVRSGPNSLPVRGRAVVAVDRVGERVTVRWDGVPIATDLCAEPLAEVRIVVGYMARVQHAYVSHFGEVGVRRFRLEGEEAGGGGEPGA